MATVKDHGSSWKAGSKSSYITTLEEQMAMETITAGTTLYIVHQITRMGVTVLAGDAVTVLTGFRHTNLGYTVPGRNCRWQAA